LFPKELPGVDDRRMLVDVDHARCEHEAKLVVAALPASFISWLPYTLDLKPFVVLTG
jgi:hypothetical protein